MIDSSNTISLALLRAWALLYTAHFPKARRTVRKNNPRITSNPVENFDTTNNNLRLVSDQNAKSSKHWEDVNVDNTLNKHFFISLFTQPTLTVISIPFSIRDLKRN